MADALPPTEEPPAGADGLAAEPEEVVPDAAPGLPLITAPETLVVEAAFAPPAVVTDSESPSDPLAV
jgi:hypothetical protein